MLLYLNCIVLKNIFFDIIKDIILKIEEEKNLFLPPMQCYGSVFIKSGCESRFDPSEKHGTGFGSEIFFFVHYFFFNVQIIVTDFFAIWLTLL